MVLENSLILCWGWNCHLQKEELEVLPSLLGMNSHHMFPRFFLVSQCLQVPLEEDLKTKLQDPKWSVLKSSR
jgi:hypothetical protein